jgi:hypothetical protein
MRNHAISRASIAEKVTITEVLRLANRPAANSRGYFACPVHKDDRPSAHVVPNSADRAWTCFACDARGGILALGVALKLGYDRASVARYLEDKFRGLADRG